MKLISYTDQGSITAALCHNEMVHDLKSLHPSLPTSMEMFLEHWEQYYPIVMEAYRLLKEGKISMLQSKPVDRVSLLAPVPFPGSCRDGYAFRQHVAAARRNRSVPMIPEFDQYPVFYFTNHRSIIGQGPVACMADHFEQLDFELEAAI
ncbi:MAG: fumarylacetoacetate hydrolase family protein, partial [Bacteroidota bacterium]|nr:fumarylacetoacetate hydrolase family protein [Bacteroidota bacterium]